MLLPVISAATTAAAMTRGLHPAERPAAETTQRGPTHPPRGLSKGPTRESSAPPRDEDCRWAPRARTAPGCAIADRALTRTEIQTPGPSIETRRPSRPRAVRGHPPVSPRTARPFEDVLSAEDAVRDQGGFAFSLSVMVGARTLRSPSLPGTRVSSVRVHTRHTSSTPLLGLGGNWPTPGHRGPPRSRRALSADTRGHTWPFFFA